MVIRVAQTRMTILFFFRTDSQILLTTKIQRGIGTDYAAVWKHECSFSNRQNPTQPRSRNRHCVGFIVTTFQRFTIRKWKGKEINYTNYTQTLHLTLHYTDLPRVTKCIVCASNYTQTIHKLYIEAFKTLHSERSKPYTEAFKTLHNGVQSTSTGVSYKPSYITLCRSLKSPSL